MSDMSTALAQALAALGTFKGDALSYCATVAGSYTALTGFIIHVDRVDAVRSNDGGMIEEQWETATLKGPLSPALSVGYFIKDTLNNNRVWYLEGIKVDQQQIARLRRIDQGIATPNRGGSR